ncbi:HIT family protein [Halarcobacter ebronensis]|uniref:Diadenosine tetraphosphate hydrolase n=1 Tax=Halarcobacter ebronensis TaxID=1462615 RepID=A0A4Q1AVU6_9BACT|nr:HIT family protein [Halarcobacter ebronensis]QKF81921.1 diadenosine tetraphosphate (Ap4A) hydrolase, HIT family [Halarcobacter ebronensis]RXK04360.1 diadenosine tetraphosphate hydrolase [Halarcobacter ebronensis]
MKKNCIFCNIVEDNSKCHKVWEDENHLAFLSIYPNCEGVTVVIPKKHYSSYAFELEDKVLNNLILAAKKVALLLDKTFDDVSRTAMVLEGFGVDHVHVKLYPLHGTQEYKNSWKEIKSNKDDYFDKYLGYISSHDSNRAKDEDLEKLAKKIRGEI